MVTFTFLVSLGHFAQHVLLILFTKFRLSQGSYMLETLGGIDFS